MPDRDFEFLPFGAIIKSFFVNEINIVQGFEEEEHYEEYNAPHYGETIGRVANRIAGAKIDNINNKTIFLAENDGENSLHGGIVGWGKRVWDGPRVVAYRPIPSIPTLIDGKSVEFALRDLDGSEGFPGTLEVSVIYTTGTQHMENGKHARVLGINYQAVLAAGDVEETVVNVTNHSYFNLSSRPTIDGTIVSLGTDYHLPSDASWIPVSGPAEHPTIIANKRFTLGSLEPRFNECMIVARPSENIPLDTRTLPVQLLVTAYHPETEIHLEVMSTEPAFQFYTGDYIDVAKVSGEKGIGKRGARSGFCVEPSRYVNAANVTAWREQVLLKKGQTYGSHIVYRAWSDK